MLTSVSSIKWGELILLLHYLSGLRELRMDTNSFVSIVGFAALGKLKGGVPAGLCSLQSLTLINEVYVEHMRLYDLEDARRHEDYSEGSNGGDGFTFSDYYYESLACFFKEPTLPAESAVPFMALPSLVNLSVSHLAADKSDTMSLIECFDSQRVKSNTPRKLLPRCSPVTTLSFFYCKLDDTFMHRMLELCQELKVLTYEVDVEYNAAAVIFSNTIKSLSPVRSTLQDLNLQTNSESMTQKHSQIKFPNTSNFHLLLSLDALTHLRINAMDLLGRPPSGTELTLPLIPLHTLALPSSLEFIELDLSGVQYPNWKSKDILQVLDINADSVIPLLKRMPNLRKIHLRQGGDWGRNVGRVCSTENIDLGLSVDLEVKVLRMHY